MDEELRNLQNFHATEVKANPKDKSIRLRQKKGKISVTSKIYQ